MCVSLYARVCFWIVLIFLGGMFDFVVLTSCGFWWVVFFVERGVVVWWLVLIFEALV